MPDQNSMPIHFKRDVQNTKTLLNSPVFLFESLQPPVSAYQYLDTGYLKRASLMLNF